MIQRGLAGAKGWLAQRVWPQAPVMLIYHRVADPARDQWGISVSPERFAEQIAALTSVRHVVPLDALAAIARGEAKAPAGKPLAAITFDDGYLDNLTNARPVLESHDAPATIFLVTSMVGADREYWWDELSQIFLETEALPEEMASPFKGEPRVLRFSPGDRAARSGAGHFFRARFRDMPLNEVEAHLQGLRAWAGVVRHAREDKRVMTADEVAAIDGALISIGAHTVNHPSLEDIGPAEQQHEIAESRAACEAWVNRPVKHFAYPFGRFNSASVAAARAAGFDSGCTTQPGVMAPMTNPFRLPRISPGQMSGEALERALG
ncbi:MAG TPA: polysaccharide deacetylase family protein [Caulobacteraceae bacterium]